jgi:hypothetical protein
MGGWGCLVETPQVVQTGSIVEGKLSNQRERVLEFISKFPGRDDDEIAAALQISPRQTVNQICRQLCREQLLYRAPGQGGKLVNFATVDGHRSPIPSQTVGIRPQQNTSPSGAAAIMSEDQVKAALVAMLEPESWVVEVAWGKKRGIDIAAVRGEERWVIECKGAGSLARSAGGGRRPSVGDRGQFRDREKRVRSEGALVGWYRASSRSPRQA